MTLSELQALLPVFAPALGAVALMLVLAIGRHRGVMTTLTLLVLAVSLAALTAGAGTAATVSRLLVVNDASRLFMGLIFAASIVVVLLAHDYLRDRETRPEELLILVLLASSGAAVLTCAAHFASFLLGLEILSVALYSLIAYCRGASGGIEAGIKYLVLATVSAVLLIFGMALVYAETGTMEFFPLRMPDPASALSSVAMAGLGLVVVGVAFKLALAPFHLWAPDVYEGAPAPVTALIATVSKAGVFAVLLRVFEPLALRNSRPVVLLFALLAVVSMLAGNLLALRQNNLKRILAYSSIAHFGYLLVAFLAHGPMAAVGVSFYLAAYFVSILGAVGVIAVLSHSDPEAASLEEYQGLARRRPFLAAVLTLMMLSLAGIPLTAGFVGKFYIMGAGVGSELWVLLGVLVVSSVIGLFYYLRVIAVLFASEPAPVPAALPPRRPFLSLAALAALAAALVGFGLLPGPLVRLIEKLLAV